MELLPGERIRTAKSLSRAEEYLSDHFPSFPVMPGVMMLECMTQSASWLVRATEGFGHSLFWLEEARNVTYKSFVAPGRVLEVELKCRSMSEHTSSFDGKGWCGDTEMVKARLTIHHANLADRNADLAEIDRELIAHARTQFELLGGATLAAPGA
jgi:3-hydroxyacyl-[acyl-carrier-protein] dehydratase